jgi:hypothetical protein
MVVSLQLTAKNRVSRVESEQMSLRLPFTSYYRELCLGHGDHSTATHVDWEQTWCLLNSRVSFFLVRYPVVQSRSGCGSLSTHSLQLSTNHSTAPRWPMGSTLFFSDLPRFLFQAFFVILPSLLLSTSSWGSCLCGRPSHKQRILMLIITSIGGGAMASVQVFEPYFYPSATFAGCAHNNRSPAHS